MREQIYKVVKKAEPGDVISKYYDVFIMVVAFISVCPLMFKESNSMLVMIDTITVYILFTDYIFNWITYDYKIKKDAPWVFVAYPFTPFALIDLVSILPSLGLLGAGFRILRVLRVFKVLYYSKTFSYVANVFKNERKTLGYVLIIALAYIFVSALAMFAYEPDTFDNFFEALYWATTALTTVGYGDVYPVTEVGRLISMISSLFGIAVIAMPAGVVTAGFMDEIGRAKELERLEKAKKEGKNLDEVIEEELEEQNE
ncbi:MAG: ion transporter [Eubacterium sp.]|nr:ion transporter [Eubacterium sp.]